MSWWHRHRWVIAAADDAKHPLTGNNKKPGPKATLVLYRCAHPGCPGVHTELFDGSWTLADLTGKGDQ